MNTIDEVLWKYVQSDEARAAIKEVVEALPVLGDDVRDGDGEVPEAFRVALEEYATRCVESEEMHAAPGCSPDESRTVIARVSASRAKVYALHAQARREARSEAIEEAAQIAEAHNLGNGFEIASFIRSLSAPPPAEKPGEARLPCGCSRTDHEMNDPDYEPAPSPRGGGTEESDG